MNQLPVPVRDLTDPEQNQAVLDLASVLVEEGLSGERTRGRNRVPNRTADRARTGAAGNPAIAAEAAAAARSRERLAALNVPVHLTVVWPMYGETGRMVPRAVHPHGEDFVRVKVRQLDWLTAGLPDVTWNIIACDDGCPDRPSSADLMDGIVVDEGYPAAGHRGVAVLRLAEVIAGRDPAAAGSPSTGPAFDRLVSTEQSRKGGAVVAGLVEALRPSRRGYPGGAESSRGTGRHVVCATDADLSANLAQVGSLVAPIVAGDGVAGALGQRYGVDGAVLVRSDGPVTEPRSTGGKPDKIMVLFRNFVRALLIPDLASAPDTQAGFKAFDADRLAPVLPLMTSFDETFDVELLVHLSQLYGPGALVAEPIVFTEDFAATNFPSVDPGTGHLAMIHHLVDLHERLIAPVAPVTGETAGLLTLLKGLRVDGYVELIERLRAEDAGDPTLFDRRWPVAHLRELLRP